MRAKIPLNFDWHFMGDCNDINVADNLCSCVDIPHSSCTIPLESFDESITERVCVYKKTVKLPLFDADDTIILRFDGAAHTSKIYINGEFVSEHLGGYTPFNVDITRFAAPGASINVAAVIDSVPGNFPPFGATPGFLTFGGIYREVWLIVLPRVRVEDVFMYCQDYTTSKISVEVTTCNADGMRLKFDLWDGRKLLFFREIPANDSIFSFEVPDLVLWSLDDPHMYDAELTLLDAGGKTVDKVRATTGFRDAKFRADGFYLNGKRIQLRGLNRHQMYPYVGYAMPRSAQEKDAEILKRELGCNIVRTAHYPQSTHFLDACDRLGLLVFEEIAGWQFVGENAWQSKAFQSMEAMIKRDRNHPSIVLWGVRINESADNDVLYKKTNAFAHILDPTRQTGGARCAEKGRLLEDVYTFNDYIYNLRPQMISQKTDVCQRTDPYLITEFCGHMFPVKITDSAEKLSRHAQIHDDTLAAAEKEGIAGAIGYAFSDFNAPEEFGGKERTCYYGVTDGFRLPKPAAAVYAARGGGSLKPAAERKPKHVKTLEAAADKTRLFIDDTYDVTRVVVRFLDSAGAVVPSACETLTLTVSGAIEIIGGTVIESRAGMAAFWVRTTGRTNSTATVTVACPRFHSQTAKFEIISIPPNS